MYWNGYIEKVGTGTEDIIVKCRDYGLQTPEFHQEEDFRVVIWRNKSDDNSNIAQIDPNVDPNVIQIIESIRKNPKISRAELAEQLQISERKTRMYIELLKDKGVLMREGPTKRGKWIIK